MNPTLEQTYRRFRAVGHKVLRVGAPALLAVTALTVVTSVPASAYAPRIHKPGAPTAVIAIALSEGAAVSWTAPASDGGSPITGYTVIASHGGQTCTTTGASMCTLTGLTNGHLYTVKVRASNAKGEGPAARVQVTPLPTVSFVTSVYFPFSGGSVGVDLSQPASNTVQVDFTNSDGPFAGLYWAEWVGGAAAFSPNSGTVTFAPGQTSTTIPFAVNLNNFSGYGCAIPALTPCYPSVAVTLADPTNAILGTTPVTDLFYLPASG